MALGKMVSGKMAGWVNFTPSVEAGVNPIEWLLDACCLSDSVAVYYLFWIVPGKLHLALKYIGAKTGMTLKKILSFWREIKKRRFNDI